MSNKVTIQSIIRKIGSESLPYKNIQEVTVWKTIRSFYRTTLRLICLKKYVGKKIRIWSILILVIAMCMIIKTIAGQKFTSVSDFQAYIKNFGIAAPLILTLFQAFQVVVPILPGYLGCAAGAVAFGPIGGFLCNYIGISAGSIAAYYVAKKYGIDVVLTMFSEKQYLK